MLRGIAVFLGCLVLGAVVMQVRASRAPQRQPGAFENYRSWALLTKEPVDMSPALSASCIGPRPQHSAPSPHAPRVFNVFANPLAKKTLLGKVGRAYPVGSMIVKEKYARPAGLKQWDPVTLPKGAVPELLTAMVKREKGFAPKDGDWQYMVLSRDGKTQTTKGLEYCAKCHQTEKSNDYVFADYLAFERMHKKS